jgi:hypothetical protein
MARNGKVKSGKSSKDTPRKVKVQELIEEKSAEKSAEPKVQAKAATEATGTAKHEDIVRQKKSPTPARREEMKLPKAPRPQAAKPAEPVKPPKPSSPQTAKREEAVVREPTPVTPAKPRAAVAATNGRQPPATESPVDTWQRSFLAARLGTVEVNRMLLDIGQRNITSSLDFAKSLAGVKSPMEAARLQLAFFDERMKALVDQAAELRALSAEFVAKANEPFRAHMQVRGMTAWWR